jgi:hypothetical protein
LYNIKQSCLYLAENHSTVKNHLNPRFEIASIPTKTHTESTIFRNDNTHGF